MRKFLERSISSLSIPTKSRFNVSEMEERPQPTIAAPLAGLTKDELFLQIDAFALHYGIEEDANLLKRGALLAQNMQTLESSGSSSSDNSETTDATDELTLTGSTVKARIRRRQIGLLLNEDELEAIRQDKDHPWKGMTKPLFLSVLICSLGAFCQGTDQSSITGALMTFPLQMGVATIPGLPNYESHEWITGLISASPYIGAFACAVWISDPVNEKLGRRGTLFLAALITIAVPLGSAFTETWWELMICRLLLGLGIGFMEVTAPVFAAENAPTSIRGALVSSWQIYTALGILFGSSSNLIFSEHNIGRHSWRFQIGTAIVPAVPLALGIYWCPESPRWYINKSRIKDAWKSLLRLRKHEILAARDLYLLYVQLLEERAVMGRGNIFKRFRELFYRNRLRQATLASFVVMIGQQMCGINIIAFFAGTIFQLVTGNVTQSLWASWGFGLCNFVFSWGAIWTIDSKLGRRGLLLATFPFMFLTLLAAGLSNLASETAVRLPLVALFIYIFTAIYSIGGGPVPFSYSAEVFPLSHREVGMSIAVFWNNAAAAILSVTYFRIQAVMTMTGAFAFYAGLNLVAWVMIFLWVPETKQLSLEELNAVFAISTTKFMRHQVEVILPYYYQRYILRDKKVRVKPLAKVTRFEDIVPVKKEEVNEES